MLINKLYFKFFYFVCCLDVNINIGFIQYVQTQHKHKNTSAY